MKGLTQGLKNRSIEKWKSIIEATKEGDRAQIEIELETNDCGFCEAAKDECCACSLFPEMCSGWDSKDPKSKYRVFDGLVDYGDLSVALPLAEDILAAIEATPIDKEAK